MTSDMERARAITAWGIFSLNQQMSMKLQKVATLSKPASRIDVAGDHDFDWMPYPRSNQIMYAAKRAHLPQIRQGLAEMTDIILHVEYLLDDEELSMSFTALCARVEDPYNRLQQWLADWRDASQTRKEPIPQLLILRVNGLHAMMHLVEMLIERDQQGSMIAQLQQKWCAQAEEIAQCLRIHRQSYGIWLIPSQVIDIVQAVFYTLVHHLESSNTVRHAFIEFCRFGIALGQKSKPMAETIYAIQSLSQRGSIQLPTEAITILDGSKLWKGQ
ncbi:unnamed protein product [Penicillium pancosmium]